MHMTAKQTGGSGKEDPAWARMQALRGALAGFVLKKVKQPQVAEDLAQDILLKASQRLERVRDLDKLEAWIFGIARNTVADYYRKQRPTIEFREELHGLAWEDPVPVLSREEKELQRQLKVYIRGVVEKLPPLYREALKLTEYEGLSQVDLARKLKLSLPGAKSRVQRARRMVKDEMERCCRWEMDRYGTVLGYERRKNRPCGCEGNE